MHWWQPTILVDVQRDFLDVVSLLINCILGVVAVYSLWLSRKALKKSEWESSMNTAPSVIIRPKNIWIGTRHDRISHGYGVHTYDTHPIKKVGDYTEIVFTVEFECFNAGRGVAFNIIKPQIKGIELSDFRNNKVPLYLTKEDETFEITVWQKAQFEEFYKNAELEIPVNITLFYTNDQNNVFCKSSWSAKIKPFDREGDDLKIRDVRLLDRNGKIEYSETPYEN